MHVTIRGPFVLKPADTSRLAPLTPRKRERMGAMVRDPSGYARFRPHYLEATNARGELVALTVFFRRPGRCSVIDVYVSGRARRRGLGTLLAVAAKHEARRLWRDAMPMVTPLDAAGRRTYRAAGLMRRCG